MKFYTQFNKPPAPKEKLSSVSICEKTGYVPADVMITRMINAGKVFRATRAQYDFLDGGTIDMNQDVDLRNPGTDLVDVTMKIRTIREAMKPIVQSEREMESLAEQANPQPPKENEEEKDG